MAKVPDLGSDFAQKLLQDLRQRREKLRFESLSAQRRSNAAPRDAYSNSHKPLRSQKPQQRAPGVGRPEATTRRSYQQSSNAIVRAGKPRHRDAPIAHSHDIVPFQSGGGGRKQKPANNIDAQMALALALSNSGKLQNIELLARNGSIFFREASDYMEGSGNGKVLLLKGKENRKSSTHSSSAARLVEIVDEDSETEQAKNGRSSSNASMQIVAHKKSQSYSPKFQTATQVLQLSTVTSNSKSYVSKGEKDDSKVRMPSVIAKLMGLENLPSAKVVAERKGTEKFVKPEVVARKEISANATVGKLPIRIVASERALVKGQNKKMPAVDWKIGLTNSEESESAIALSNSSSFPTIDKRTRQTMKQLLSKKESPVRRGGEIRGVNEKTIHENKKLTEESKLQKAVSVGCRTDAGKKMDFFKRFRINSENIPATEEKPIIQEKNKTVGKKQATSMKQLLGRGSDVKSRGMREKFNKENLATTETKAAGKNGKTDQMRRQAQSKQIDKQSMAKKAHNYREMQSETPIQNLEGKKSLKLEATHMKKKLACTEVIQHQNDRQTKVNEIGSGKLSDRTHGEGGIFEELERERKDCSTTGVDISDQSVKKIIEEINAPTVVVQTSDESEIFYQSATAEINDDKINRTAETTQILETFTEGEQQQQQQQQMVEVKERPMDDLDHTTKFSNPIDLQDHKMHVMSYDSFTENQLLLMEMLLKDQYLLKTSKTIVRIHVPVNAVKFTSVKLSDKGNNVLSDIGQEVIRRKGKRTEAMVDVSMTHIANLKLQYLDDLIRELDGDIESLNISKKPHRQSDDSTAENLQMILHRDIQNNHPDANSMWDFGWNRVSDLPVEKNEVVKDLEKNILGGIITDVARELIEVPVRHGCCACEA